MLSWFRDSKLNNLARMIGNHAEIIFSDGASLFELNLGEFLELILLVSHLI